MSKQDCLFSYWPGQQVKGGGPCNIHLETKPRRHQKQNTTTSAPFFCFLFDILAAFEASRL